MQDVRDMRAVAGELLDASRNLADASANLLAAAEACERGEGARKMASGLRRMAVEAGLPDKPYYSITEVAKASGIPRTTLDDARRAGRRRSMIPVGCERGLLIRCDWFDDWTESGFRSGKECSR